MQRNFEPLARHIELVQQAPLTNDAAKLVIYRAFVQGELEIPRHLARAVHGCYFEPAHEEFHARTAWSLSNAFTSAFKELDAVPGKGPRDSAESRTHPPFLNCSADTLELKWNTWTSCTLIYCERAVVTVTVALTPTVPVSTGVDAAATGVAEPGSGVTDAFCCAEITAPALAPSPEAIAPA